MNTSVKSESQRWVLDCDSAGPAWVDVLGTSYHLGLACRTFLSTEGWTKKSATQSGLLKVAERLVLRSSGVIFADEMVMAAILIDDDFRSEIAKDSPVPAIKDFSVEKFLSVDRAVVAKVRNALAPTAGPLAQVYRKGGQKARKGARMATIAAQQEAKAEAKRLKAEAKAKAGT